jgi:hypothetical protein
MSTDRDITSVVRSWLDEGVTVLPDRVLDAVLDQVPTTPQRRAWWPAWRFRSMSNSMKIAVAAAAVVLLAIIGIGVLLPKNNGIGPSVATPTPSPKGLPSTGRLEPGRYYVPAVEGGWTPVAFTFSVPAGWATNTDGFFNKQRGEPGEVAFSAWGDITHVYGNGCRTEGTLIEIGPTVDELADALASQEDRETSGPTDITMAGYPAKRVELSVPAAWDNPACENLRNWPGAGGDENSGWFSRPGQTDVVYIVEVDGKRVVINTWHFPGTPEADITELEGIIASIRFEP